MSGDIIKGRTSRKIMTVMAAVVAVAMMLAVPIFVAVDSDAAFTNDNAGYNITFTNPTEAQLAEIGTDKASSLLGVLESEMEIFNTAGVFGAPTATADSFEMTKARGEKVTDDSTVSIYVTNLKATNVKITMNIVSNGKLIDPDQSGWTDAQKKAADAIAAYIGNDVVNGDKVEITGRISTEVATQIESTYKHLDGNKCIISKTAISAFGVEDTDLTLKMIRTDGTTKEISLISNGKGTGSEEATYDYKDETIAVGTKYDVHFSVTDATSGDVYYKVNGTDYSLKTEETVPADEKGLTVESENIHPDSFALLGVESLRVSMALLPQSEEGMKVDKTYDAAQSAFDTVVMDSVGNDLLKLILIIGGVILGIIVLIIILIIVLVVLKKKKKQ